MAESLNDLLALAAKAAGAVYEPAHGWMLDGVHWNPLEDDGQSLRLQLQRRVSVAFDPWRRGGFAIVVSGNVDERAYGVARYFDQRELAAAKFDIVACGVRLAVVQVVAEQVRAML